MNMKVALVHDSLSCVGGAERVLLQMHKVFPDAPIFTMVYNEQILFDELACCDIRTSFLQNLVLNKRHFKKLMYPFGIWAMELMDVSDFEVVIYSTTHAGKYVRRSPNSTSITYCHTPFRLAWLPESYRAYNEAPALKKILLRNVIRHLREIDLAHASRCDNFVANSRTTRDRIKQFYGIPDHSIRIIHPSIDCHKFVPSTVAEDYYLVVSRLEAYKRVDLAIQAANILKRKLFIVGDGVERENLRRLAGPTISFLGLVTDSDLAQLYARAKALIFPQFEDFGLVPLESIASGTPVIAFGRGGILETMIPYRDGIEGATALFFEEQSAQSLVDAITKFEGIQFDPMALRARALIFDDSVFRTHLRLLVDSIVSEEYVGLGNSVAVAV